MGALEMELLEMRVPGACAVATSSNLNRTGRDLSNCRRSWAPKSQRVIYRILPGVHQWQIYRHGCHHGHRR